MAAGQLDLVIVPASAQELIKGFQWSELRRVSLALVLAKAHPLAKLAKIPPKRLAALPLHGPLSGVVQAAAAMALSSSGWGCFDRPVPRRVSLVVLVAVGVVTYIPLCRWRAPEVAREIRRLRGSAGSRAT